MNLYQYRQKAIAKRRAHRRDALKAIALFVLIFVLATAANVADCCDRFEDVLYEDGGFNLYGDQFEYDGLVEGNHYDILVKVGNGANHYHNHENWEIIMIFGESK